MFLRSFSLEVKNVFCMDSQDLINFDQTGINYVPLTSWTMEQEGAKCVEIVARMTSGKSLLSCCIAYRRSFATTACVLR